MVIGQSNVLLLLWCTPIRNNEWACSPHPNLRALSPFFFHSSSCKHCATRILLWLSSNLYGAYQLVEKRWSSWPRNCTTASALPLSTEVHCIQTLHRTGTAAPRHQQTHCKFYRIFALHSVFICTAPEIAFRILFIRNLCTAHFVYTCTLKIF